MEHTKETFSHKVGQQLRQIRKEQNLTREQLAEQANISSKYLYEIEKGRKNCSLYIIYRLCSCLKVNLEHILKENNE